MCVLIADSLLFILLLHLDGNLLEWQYNVTIFSHKFYSKCGSDNETLPLQRVIINIFCCKDVVYCNNCMLEYRGNM